jgi:ketosteroid isomerase-like protein
MKQITYLVLTCALAATTSSFAPGQGTFATTEKTSTVRLSADTVAEELLELERAYHRVFIRPTVADIERLHTDDFTMTARGKVTTKAEALARLKDGSHAPSMIESLTPDDIKVRVYGNTAVTTGRWTRVSKDADGKDTSAAGFFTHVWVKQNNKWLVAVAHYSLAAAPARP